MNKKKMIIIIVSAIVAVAVLVGLGIFLSGFFKSGSSSGEPTVTAGEVSGSAGDTVTVPVKFTGNPGAMGFFLEFKYDNEKLEYVSFEKGNLITDCEVADSKGTLKMVSVEDNDVKKDGTLINIKFKIKDGASGESKVDVICGENSICNYDEKSISAKAVAGKVIIE